MAFKSTLKPYYILVKPGIIYGNILTTLAGFMYACKWHIDFRLLICCVVGTALVIGAGCVFNNYTDRHIDKQMKRTSKRPLVTGAITVPQALIYGCCLLIGGFVILALGVNTLTALVGTVGFIDYVFLYAVFKRRSTIGTLVGSISGAMPIVAGYTAVTNHLDISSTLLFLILVAWQMPHFYAIAIYRRKDYRSAGLPVLPVAKSIKLAKQRIIAYIVGLVLVLSLLKVFSHAGYFYLIISLYVTLSWLIKGIKTFKNEDQVVWGKRMFLQSLIVICGLSVAIGFGSLLP